MTERFESRKLGPIAYSPDAVLEFPFGLHGFEHRTLFVLMEQQTAAPVVFLQSLEDPGLCFAAAPASIIYPNYRFQLDEEGVEALKVEDDSAQVTCLAVLTVPNDDQPPTANLKAPILIHKAARRGCQVIQFEGSYSFRHPLAAILGGAGC